MTYIFFFVGISHPSHVNLSTLLSDARREKRAAFYFIDKAYQLTKPLGESERREKSDQLVADLVINVPGQSENDSEHTVPFNII